MSYLDPRYVDHDVRVYLDCDTDDGWWEPIEAAMAAHGYQAYCRMALVPVQHCDTCACTDAVEAPAMVLTVPARNQVDAERNALHIAAEAMPWSDELDGPLAIVRDTGFVSLTEGPA